MSEREDRSQYCNGAYEDSDAVDVIGKRCTHKIGSDDGGSDGGTRSMVLRMENDGAEVTHHNRCVGPKLDLLCEKDRAHVQVQSPVQVQTMDLTPSRSNALAKPVTLASSSHNNHIT